MGLKQAAEQGVVRRPADFPDSALHLDIISAQGGILIVHELFIFPKGLIRLEIKLLGMDDDAHHPGGYVIVQ